MIQFILDNNVFIIYVFMGLSLIFLVRTYYQWDRDGEMFIPVVALFCSFLIFFFLALATGDELSRFGWAMETNLPKQCGCDH